MKKLSIILFALGFIFVSCSKDDTPPPPSGKRTVLAYMVADNNLDDYFTKNVKDMIKGIKEGNNLIVFSKMPGSTTSKLIKIAPASSLDIDEQEVLKTYNEVEVLSVGFMQRVMNDAFGMFPAESYGMIVSTHGQAWVPQEMKVRSGIGTFSSSPSPSSFFWNYDEDTPEIVTRSFGANNAYMEIKDFAAALGNRKLDFLLFDACFMANIETYYDLRNSAEYIISSVAEILADGFPYVPITPLLFEENFSPVKVCEAFTDYYADSYGAVSYVKTSEIDALAATVKAINRQGVPELTPAQAEQVQAYEKAAINVFYDMDAYMKKRVADPALYNAFATQLAKTVPYATSTDVLYGNTPYSGTFNVTSSCGISVYIPVKNEYGFNDAYYRTSWHLATAAN